jgi:hypothetical protein
VDTAFVGRLGLLQLAALGPNAALFNVLFFLGFTALAVVRGLGGAGRGGCCCCMAPLAHEHAILALGAAEHSARPAPRQLRACQGCRDAAVGRRCS